MNRRIGQRRLIRAAAVVIAVLTTAALVGLLVPVRGMLRDRDRTQFEIRAEMLTRDAAGFFHQSVQIARQTPSRTRIREELVAYLRGERSLASYREFAEPKLADAVAATPEMVGVFRYDPVGRLLVRADGSGVPAPEFAVDPDRPTVLSDTFSWRGTPAFFVCAPINHPGFGLAGYDIVALTMDLLADRMTDAVDGIPGLRVLVFSSPNAGSSGGEMVRVPVAAGATVEEIRAFREAISVASASLWKDVIELDGRRFAAHLAELSDRWAIAVLLDDAVLYRETRRSVALIAVSVALVGVGLGLGARWSLEVIRERSRAESRELFIREVHHRIKNDMGLVRSFLRLHLQETESEEARGVLKEAESKLAVMSEIYDQLYRSSDFGMVQIRPVVERLLSDVRSATRGRSVAVNAQIADIELERSLATSLSIVVNELVTNALKYSDAEQLAVDVILEQNENELILTVEDNGSGFPKHVIEGDYGFGLTMVKALVEQAEGDVRLGNGGVPRVRVVLPKETR